MHQSFRTIRAAAREGVGPAHLASHPGPSLRNRRLTLRGVFVWHPQCGLDGLDRFSDAARPGKTRVGREAGRNSIAPSPNCAHFSEFPAKTSQIRWVGNTIRRGACRSRAHVTTIPSLFSRQTGATDGARDHQSEQPRAGTDDPCNSPCTFGSAVACQGLGDFLPLSVLPASVVNAGEKMHRRAGVKMHHWWAHSAAHEALLSSSKKWPLNDLMPLH
jgi:hypothetical protein